MHQGLLYHKCTVYPDQETFSNHTQIHLTLANSNIQWSNTSNGIVTATKIIGYFSQNL